MWDCASSYLGYQSVTKAATQDFHAGRERKQLVSEGKASGKLAV